MYIGNTKHKMQAYLTIYLIAIQRTHAELTSFLIFTFIQCDCQQLETWIGYVKWDMKTEPDLQQISVDLAWPLFDYLGATSLMFFKQTNRTEDLIGTMKKSTNIEEGRVREKQLRDDSAEDKVYITNYI